MEMSEIYLIVGAVFGQVVHIVKKKTEGEGNEIDTFKRWVLHRPFNTLSASAVAIGAAYALAGEGQTAIQSFGVAFMAGMASNSTINKSS